MGHYHSWWKARLETLDKYVSFKGKTVLDIGSGFGSFAACMHEKGANVICSDGRREYIDMIKNRFGSKLATRIDDYDTQCDFPSVDIITHFGVLHCLKDIEAHIDNLVGRSQYLLLDVDVVDSDDPFFPIIQVSQQGYDQSLNGTGSYTSEKYIERILTQKGFTFVQILEPTLNTMVHKYNWEIKNTGKYAPGQSRFWLCAQKGFNLSNICNTKVVMFDQNICRDDNLDANIRDRAGRINAYVCDDKRQQTIDTLIEHGYIIYGWYPSQQHNGFVSILAVTPEVRDNETVSFVIQGKPSGVTTEVLRNLTFQHGVVIDVTWKPWDLQQVLDQPYYNNQNVNVHVAGTLIGLEKVTTKFAVKCRGDEYYSNIKLIKDLLEAYPDKIISNNVFARKTGHYPYHISDHIIAGSTSNMIGMFSSALTSIRENKYKHLVAEQRLTKCYLSWKLGIAVDDLPTDHNDITNLMTRHMHIVSIRDLGEYQVTVNSFGRVFTNTMSESDYRFLTEIDRIEDI